MYLISSVLGVMGGPMGNPAGMVGMGNQMVPAYGAPMQNQMGNMGMGPQVGYELKKTNNTFVIFLLISFNYIHHSFWI